MPISFFICDYQGMMASSNWLSYYVQKSVVGGLTLMAVAVWPASAADSEVLHYTARLHGVRLLEITFCLTLDNKAYSASMAAHTVGMAEMLVHGRSEGSVDGIIDGARVKPRTYDEHSRLSGEDYAIAIAYPDGSPVLRMSTPSQAKYRTPVPSGDLPGAIDGLSAVALESLVTTRTGTCKGVTLVYDGRQLRRATTYPAGSDMLKPNLDSVFSGLALRCDTDSILLAGFLKSDAVKAQTKPRHSSAWLAPVLPGGPDIPVKLSFDADFMGNVIVDLDAKSQTQGRACAPMPATTGAIR